LGKNNKKSGGFEVEIDDDLIADAVTSVEKHQQSEAAPTPQAQPSTEHATGDITPVGAMAPASASTSASNDKGEYYERLVRVSADFDNFRKRYLKEKGDWVKYGAENFIRAFLPTLDNLERAIKQCPAEPNYQAIRTGLKMVLDQMFRNMTAEGVSLIDPSGQVFDPLLHEALTTRVDASVPPQTVLEVHHKGYKLWDRLLRPALVTVSVSGRADSQEA
jgi:molecular chaperone GrpE